MPGLFCRCRSGRQPSECCYCVFFLFCCWGPQRCFFTFPQGPQWCSILFVWGPQWCPPVCSSVIVIAGPPSRQASLLGGAPTKAMMLDLDGDGMAEEGITW